jgi:hypothetical protein
MISLVHCPFFPARTGNMGVYVVARSLGAGKWVNAEYNKNEGVVRQRRRQRSRTCGGSAKVTLKAVPCQTANAITS